MRKFGENPLMFTQVIIRKRTDGHMDVQCETIIHRHYRVVGYTHHYHVAGILWSGI